MSSIFSGVASAKATNKSNHLLPGLYKVRINACKTQTAQVGGKVWAIIEFEILESSVDTLKPGMSAAQMINMVEVMGPVNVKKFIAAASGVRPDDPEINEKVEAHWSKLLDRKISIDDICGCVFSDVNPLEGTEFDVECVNVKTKRHTDFTVHNWKPLSA